MFQLRISPKAERKIKRFKKEYQIEVVEILSEIKEDPLLRKPLSRELNRRFVHKFKAYRIIYKVNLKDNIVSILDADHRERVYN